MSEFKIGDRVRISDSVKDQDYAQAYDLEGTLEIKSIVGNMAYFKDRLNGCYISRLVPCPKSPVKVVTKKEIIPGVYGERGQVAVYTNGAGKVGVTVTCVKDNIQETINFLTQIADAMEA